ncbi:MAG: hypothetical protein ABIO83_01210 [Ilumatobacteraceae bacterium]
MDHDLEAASRANARSDGLAAMAILVLTAALIIFVARMLLS